MKISSIAAASLLTADALVGKSWAFSIPSNPKQATSNSLGRKGGRIPFVDLEHSHSHSYSHSQSQIRLRATIEEVSEEGVEEGEGLSLLDNTILSRIEEASSESKQWAEDFDLVEESGAAFHALFSGIRSSAALGLKGSPFYLKGADVCKVMSDSGGDPFKGFFTFQDLSKALEEDFLDADRGSTDNRQGWKVCLCMMKFK